MRSAVLALVGALALVACGRSGGDGGGTVVTSIPRDDGYQKPRSCDGGITLSLLGANPGPVSSLVLHLLGGIQLHAHGGGPAPAFEGPPFLMLDVSTDAHIRSSATASSTCSSRTAPTPTGRARGCWST